MKKIRTIFLLFSICSKLLLFGQNKDLFEFKSENKNLMSQDVKDSIFKNNPLCQKYTDVVRLDTLYWGQYPQVSLDSIIQLQGIKANELANQALNIKHSKYYSTRPFNLIGTYNESEMRNNTHALQNIETKVEVYDKGFTSKNLPKALTKKCYYKYKSTDISPSIAEIWMTSLTGKYSNLYYLLDLDFLRMYNFPGSPELGGDRRMWSTHNFNSEHVSDDYRYYKAFKKDSSIYVILVSKRSYSIMDKPSKIKYHISKDFIKPITTEYKYLLVNLSTNAIEKTGYYKNQSHLLKPINVTSYETSYKLIENKYYLNKITKNSFLFGPNIGHISLNSISFRVDSVINDPLKVRKIKKWQADSRKVNYIDQFIDKNLEINKIKD